MMNRFQINIFIVVMIIITISCNNSDQENLIPESFYNIDVERLNNHLPPLDGRIALDDFELSIVNNLEYIEDDISSEKGFVHKKIYKNKILYKNIYSDTAFMIENSDREIVFTREIYKHKVEYASCFISINEANKAVFIYWYNKPYDSIKVHDKMTYQYKSEVGKYTDSLFTNLSLEVVKKLFKDFNGGFKNVQVENIILNESHKYFDLQYYDKIIFEGFNLGLPVLNKPIYDSTGKVIDRFW